MDRRRAMMMSAGEEIIAINSTDSPQIMQMMYDLGWASNPDYMTAKEAARVTNAQFDTAFKRPGENSSLFQMAEPFDGFQYFTGVTNAPNALFRSAKITSVVFPETITSTAANILRGFTWETGTINFPNVVTIGVWCFDSLKCAKVVIGEYVTSMGQYNFRILNVPIFIIKATTPPTLGRLQTGGVRTTIYVPDDSVEAYKSANNWSLLADKIKGMSELPT